MKHAPTRAAVHKPVNGGASFAARNRITRLFWNATWLLMASWTPSSLWWWRRALLVIFGARLAPRCDVRGSARVWLPANLSMGDRSIIAERVNCYNQAPVYIGNEVVISQGVHICAGSHNVDDPHFQLVVKPITIGHNAWIASEAFVGPGAKIGDGAVLGARGVCFGNLDPWTVYRGNPCTPLRIRKR